MDKKQQNTVNNLRKEQDIVLCILTDGTGEKEKVSPEELQNQNMHDTIHTS